MYQYLPAYEQSCNSWKGKQVLKEYKSNFFREKIQSWNEILTLDEKLKTISMKSTPLKTK